MNLLTSMLLVLSIGTAMLMTGILMSREQKQNLRSAVVESLAWGVCFFLAFGVEILMFENL